MKDEIKKEEQTNKKVEKEFYFPDFQKTETGETLEEAEKKLNKK